MMRMVECVCFEQVMQKDNEKNMSLKKLWK